MKIFFISLTIMLLSQTGLAQSECSLVKQLAERLSCGWVGYPPAAGPGLEAPKDRHFVLTSDFGPSTCKVVKSVKTAEKDLKDECEKWLSARKKELSTSYVTGSCEAVNEKCKLGMEKVSVKGLVHYSRNQVEE